MGTEWPAGCATAPGASSRQTCTLLHTLCCTVFSHAFAHVTSTLMFCNTCPLSLSWWLSGSSLCGETLLAFHMAYNGCFPCFVAFQTTFGKLCHNLLISVITSTPMHTDGCWMAVVSFVHMEGWYWLLPV